MVYARKFKMRNPVFKSDNDPNLFWANMLKNISPLSDTSTYYSLKRNPTDAFKKKITEYLK